MNGLTEYRICAMCRSGQHALINWIAGSYISNPYILNVRFYNDIKNLKNPSKNKARNFLLNGLKSDDPIDENTKAIIYNYEDCVPKKVLIDNKNQREKWFGKIDKTYDIILLRSFDNNFASRFRYKFDAKINRQNKKEELFKNKVIPLWKEYANHFLNNDYFGIYFDLFIHNTNYRKYIAKQLNLPKLTDYGLQFQGTESSFENNKKGHISVEKMNVTRRKEELKNTSHEPEWVNEVLSDKECNYLNNKIITKLCFDFC